MPAAVEAAATSSSAAARSTSGCTRRTGVAVTKTQLELAVVIEDLDVRPAAGYVFVWDKTAGKVVAYWGDNNNAADGPGVEVPNATDLTAVVARFRAEGK
jgi:hypothetical protein